MQTYTASIDDYELPDDGTLARTDLIARLDGAKVSLYVEMYGFADGELAQALLRAVKRGVPTWLIIDHTEASTPTEVKLLHAFLLGGFPLERLCITTSPKHAIMHRKMIAVDRSVVITGSTNWSTQAFLKQDNDLLMIESAEFAASMIDGFQTLFSWGRANDAAYQLTAA